MNERTIEAVYIDKSKMEQKINEMIAEFEQVRLKNASDEYENYIKLVSNMMEVIQNMKSEISDLKENIRILQRQFGSVI